jgi:hypothetical protein
MRYDKIKIGAGFLKMRLISVPVEGEKKSDTYLERADGNLYTVPRRHPFIFYPAVRFPQLCDQDSLRRIWLSSWDVPPRVDIKKLVL